MSEWLRLTGGATGIILLLVAVCSDKGWLFGPIQCHVGRLASVFVF